MIMDIKKLILDMIKFSAIAIVAGYFAAGIMRGAWDWERAIILGGLIGITYPLLQFVVMRNRRK